MAEVQKTTLSGETTQRFIEFVMMQAQNAALFLGQIPNPQTGEGEVNLELAKMFIDQLAMIQEKTRGNLSTQEADVLKNTLANLQMAFVEVSQEERGPAGGATKAPSAPFEAAQETAEPAKTEPGAAAAAPAAESESKKKFTKSYGA